MERRFNACYTTLQILHGLTENSMLVKCLAACTHLSSTISEISHTRECYKDDCESLWKSLKFDPSPCKNDSTDRPPNLHRWLRSGYLPSAKFCADSTRGFFSPYAWNITPKCSFFWFFSKATAEGPKLIFTQNTSKDAVPRKDVPFGGFENKK